MIRRVSTYLVCMLWMRPKLNKILKIVATNISVHVCVFGVVTAGKYEPGPGPAPVSAAVHTIFRARYTRRAAAALQAALQGRALQSVTG